MTTHFTVRRFTAGRRSVDGEPAGAWPLLLSPARRYPAHGDHRRHPHRAKPKESQP